MLVELAFESWLIWSWKEETTLDPYRIHRHLDRLIKATFGYGSYSLSSQMDGCMPCELQYSSLVHKHHG
eukprot:6680518-Karenia_brevis.AAC.1